MSILAFQLSNVRMLFAQGCDWLRLKRKTLQEAARDEEVDELLKQAAVLRFRLHQAKQHTKAVTRQLLDLSQRHAVLQTECSQAKAEADYWHARCTKYVAENGDMPSPPSQG